MSDTKPSSAPPLDEPTFEIVRAGPGGLATAQLDGLACTCGQPDCVMEFRPPCHPTSLFRVAYQRALKMLEHRCAECDSVGLRVAVSQATTPRMLH